VEILFMVPGEAYTFLSSSLVREVAMLGGDVSSFVTPNVLAALEQKFRQRGR
jgi:pantetheine-phosphate adenylyltransferase